MHAVPSTSAPENKIGRVSGKIGAALQTRMRQNKVIPHATPTIRMKFQIKSTLRWLLTAFAFVVSASAREYFVDPAGDDSNPGTRRAPLRTIQRGAELA